jgi:hypothetical protein
MQIVNLPRASTFAATDVLVKETGAGVTYAINLQDAADEIKRLGNMADVSLQLGLAIVVDGDIADMSVPVGGYAYIQNNTHDLVDGLYINVSSAAFPAVGGTANSSVFSSVINDGGALNIPRTKVVNGTMGAVNVDAKVANYPAGYTRDNCYVASAYMLYNGSKYPLPNANATIHMEIDGIYIFVTVSSYAGQAVVIRLSQE